MQMAEEAGNIGEQSAIWSGAGGRGWVAARELVDQVFQPLEDILVQATGSARRVLDVGCGTGGTTVAIAQRLGAGARCTGLDISEAMLGAARARAEQMRSSAEFVLGDAQTYDFESAAFDAIVSRFGVMFFADPVAAFTNLHRAAQPGANLRMIVWRSADDNPFMTTAERAAAPLLPNLPVRKPNEPGQFGFADPKRVTGIVEASGWNEVVLAPLDIPCTLPEQELLRWLVELGPVGRALQGENVEVREKVLAAVRPAFDPYVKASVVHFTAACWLLSAQA